MRTLARLVVLAGSLCLLTPPDVVTADDVTIAGEVHFRDLDGSDLDHDGEANGVFSVSDGSLTIDGVVVCDAHGFWRRACAIAFSVTGDLVMEPDSAILAESGRWGRGGDITLEVGGDLVLRTASGGRNPALVSSSQVKKRRRGHSYRRDDERDSRHPRHWRPGGGDISIDVAGQLAVEPGASIDASAHLGDAGNIDIHAMGAVDVHGLVLSGRGRELDHQRGDAQGNGFSWHGGGDITIRSSSSSDPGLLVGGTAVILSRGGDRGAGRVLLEACGLIVQGRVASIAKKGGSPRVVLRSGTWLRVDARDLGRRHPGETFERRLGELRAAVEESWSHGRRKQHQHPDPAVELFAVESIEVLGPPLRRRLGHKRYQSRVAVSASTDEDARRVSGGAITAISLGGEILASGRAFEVGPARDEGGTITLLAARDVTLDGAVLSARGEKRRKGRGGKIAVRAYQGSISWMAGIGDVRSGGARDHREHDRGETNRRHRRPDRLGTIALTYCQAVDTTGSIFPTRRDPERLFPEQIPDCSEPAPTLPPGEPELLPCNRPPVAADDRFTVAEDESLSGDVLADNGNGPDVDPDGDPLTVTTPPLSEPASGTLVLQPDGTFSYTPDPDFADRVLFEYEVTDGNGGADVGLVTIDVRPVNDAPSFTKGPDVAVLEDAGAQTLDPWATGISPGPANESSQIVSFVITQNTNPGLFSAGPSVSSAGVLTFTPAPNANGAAAVTLVAVDDGGTADGGIDTSAAQTFNVEVTPVDDAPVVTPQSLVADENTPVGVVIGTVLFSDPDVGQSHVFSILSGNTGNAFAVDAAGRILVMNAAALDFELNPSFVLTVQVTDDTVPPLSGSGPITISLRDVNEPPVPGLDTFATAGNTLLHVFPAGLIGTPGGPAATDPTPNGVLQNDVDPDAGSVVTVQPMAGSTSKAGAFDLRADGSFSYVPPRGVKTTAADPDTFQYTVTDGTNVAVGTVQIVTPERIWYVDNAATSGGDGQSQSPYDVLKDAEAQASPGDTIFVHSGDGTVTNHDMGIVLRDGQRLVGQGVDLQVDLGAGPVTLLPAGTSPLITNATGDGVSLASDNTIAGVTIEGALGAGVRGQDVEGLLTLDGVVVAQNSARGLVIDNFNGGAGVLTLAIESTSSAFRDNTGGEVHISNNAGNLSLTGVTLDGSSGTALALLATTGNAILSGTLNRTGGQTLSFTNTNGAFDLTALPVVASNAAAPLQGLALSGVVGSYSFGAVTQTGMAASFGGPGVSVADSPGASVSFGPTVVSGVTGHGVSLTSNATAPVSFVSLDVATLAGSSLVASSGGTLTVSAGSLAATGGAALDASSTVLDVTLTSLFSAGGMPGLRIAGAGGNLNAGSTTIVDPAGAGIVLQNNPTAVVNLGVLSDITTAAGAGILIDASGMVTIASSPALSATGGAAVDIRNTMVSGFSLASVSSNGSPGFGINLDGVAGPFTAGAGSIADAAGPTFRVNGGLSPVSYLGSISNSLGRAVEVTNRTGGSVTLTGNVTDTGGLGILLDNNDAAGGGVAFDGALSIVNSSGTAVTLQNSGAGTTSFSSLVIDNTVSDQTGLLAANNGAGTLSVASGSIDSGSGRGVDIDRTTLAVTLESVSSSGGSGPGIDLDTTDGSFTVTGNVAPGSGGTIQNKVGADGANDGIGILLNAASGVSLSRMQLNDFQNYAIRGSEVTNFSLSDSVIDGVNGTSSADDEGSVRFTNLLGSSAITATSISGGKEDNLRVENTSGSLDRLTISGGMISENDAATGGDGVFIEGTGDATVNVTITGVAFAAHKGDHFQLTLTESGRSDLLFVGNTLVGGHPTPLGQGIQVAGGGASQLTYSIANNGVQGAVSTAIRVDLSGNPSALFAGSISGNTIGTSGLPGSGSLGGSGIDVLLNAGGTHTVAIINNAIRQYNSLGIDVRARDQMGFAPAALNATISGNLIAEPGALAFNGLRVQAGGTSGPPADAELVCADIQGNDLVGSGAGGSTDFRLRQRFLTTLNLPGYAGLNSDDAAVASFIQAQNVGTPTGLVDNNVAGGGGGFTGAIGCPLP